MFTKKLAPMFDPFEHALKAFASTITDKFNALIAYGSEDQLKGPVAKVLEQAATGLAITIEVVTEVQEREISGRLDMGVVFAKLLAGYVELKAPGKGADPELLKGKGDKDQWEKFKKLPNVLYTDGNEWALYRSGVRQGKLVRMFGNVTKVGAKAVGTAMLTGLFR